MYIITPNARSLPVLESFSYDLALIKQPTTRMGISSIQNSTLSHARNSIQPITDLP